MTNNTKKALTNILKNFDCIFDTQSRKQKAYLASHELVPLGQRKGKPLVRLVQNQFETTTAGILSRFDSELLEQLIFCGADLSNFPFCSIQLGLRTLLAALRCPQCDVDF